MNGGEIVAGVPTRHGVRTLFTLCGGHIAPILVGCQRRGIRVIEPRHEATAVFAGVAGFQLVQPLPMMPSRALEILPCEKEKSEVRVDRKECVLAKDRFPCKAQDVREGRRCVRRPSPGSRTPG